MRKPSPAVLAGLLLMLLFTALAVSLARARPPWCDEGWFACPAHELAFRGHMGTPPLEPNGHFLNASLKGIQQRTYLVPPVYLVSLAGWFRVFGFGLQTMRAYSILWGLVLLAVTARLVWRLARDPTAALLSVALNGTCVFFLWNATDGRMDILCATLCYAGMLVYLELRERRLVAAVAASQCLTALAFYTHSNAFMGEIWLLFLFLRYDRRRFRWWLPALAAAPFVAGLLAWLPYILQAPGDFRAQFAANAAGRNAERFAGILQPWNLLAKEMADRYLGMLHPNAIWLYDVPGWTLLISIFLLGIVVACAAAGPKTRQDRDLATLCGLVVLQFTVMVLLLGMKGPYYLIFIVPLCHAALAVWVARSVRRSAFARLGATALAAAYVALNLSAVVPKIEERQAQREYAPVLRRLNDYSRQGRTILGETALGFDLPYSSFRDDVRLGMFSGLDPDVIVMDRYYRYMMRRFVEEEPGVFLYSVRLLRERYRLDLRNRLFEVYVRAGSEDPEAQNTKLNPPRTARGAWMSSRRLPTPYSRGR